MKLSFIVGAAAGYLLGSRAGRERYEDLVAIGRRVVGSQTVQATAGVVQAQLYELTGRTRRARGHAAPPSVVNGHHSN
jgi:hypothetical protein